MTKKEDKVISLTQEDKEEKRLDTNGNEVTKEEAEKEEAKLEEMMKQFFNETEGIGLIPEELIEEEEEDVIDFIVDDGGNMQIIGNVSEQEDVPSIATPSFIDDTILRYSIKKRLEKYRKTMSELRLLSASIDYINPGFYEDVDRKLSSEINKLQSVLFLETVSLDTLDESLQKKITSEAIELVEKMLDIAIEFEE